MSRCGIVVIGRNEGERLRACLGTVMSSGGPVVYADSGSSDGSAAVAASLGAVVVELDPSREFSAARARNEGFERLMGQVPGLSYVQFIDGDCELFAGWMDRGAAELDARADAVVVCGRVREKHPEASVYNRLCSLEWQKAPGEITACGGIFMIRPEAFRAVSGFRSDVVAGEEEEFCLRLRRGGGKIIHVDTDMVWHDSAMLRFSQWWRRSRRAGHAYSQGAELHGRSEDRYYVRDCLRLWFWALLLPAAAAALAWPTRGLSLALLALYPLQVLRMAWNGRSRGWSRKESWLYAFFSVMAKFPGLIGLFEHRLRRWRGKPMTIIEHKPGGAPVGGHGPAGPAGSDSSRA